LSAASQALDAYYAELDERVVAEAYGDPSSIGVKFQTNTGVRQDLCEVFHKSE